MSATYKQFLAAPNSSLLAATATLHYVTTTTSYSSPTEIIKHLGTLRNQVKKKKEEFLDVVEGRNALAVEVDTTLEFVTSGGVYLPGLDDNFLADRTVYVPIMHIVTFDADGKIAQIRQSWDQGSLLKQLEIIGRTGRNWPIRDSREQLKLITSCLTATGKIEKVEDARDIINRSRGNSTNAFRDPHTSLALFAPREEVEQTPAASFVSPYAGSRPRQRSFTEILGDEPEDEAESPSRGRDRSQSPSKFMAPKAGAGKNFQPARLFESEETHDGPETPDTAKASDRFYRPNPKKFEHFDLGDGSDPQHAPQAGVPHDQRSKSKHDSNWDFKDFETPQKVRPSKTLRHQDVRHWDTEGGVQETPGQKPSLPKPRRDAEVHFEMQDDGVPQGEPRLVSRPKGTGRNAGLHLYDSHVNPEDAEAPEVDASGRALGNITNLKDRRKDFDAHFQMVDASPSQPSASQQQHPKISEDRMKAVKMMESNWSAYDKSPASQKENKPQNGIASAKPAEDPNDRGIRIAGDGMGGPKGSDRSWMYGGDDAQDTPRAAAPKRQNPAAAAANAKNFWDF